ncbi:hypothetical protein AGDE_00197 [Angomonas deanei]|nr:hypothetical protein AGDE_00197 [Angomonas deanei]|eukprot:EPY43724.1 hypothetical protein AGDE_00197 [Angomonas deanei]
MSSAWRAVAIGRHDQSMIEYMEKTYKNDMTREECVHFAIKSLLEVVESGSKNVELLILKHHHSEYISEEELQKFVVVVEKEREEEAAKKKRQADQE